MKAALLLSALASAAIGVIAEDLKIDVTLPVVCDRKTKKGDRVQMHYRGTLKDSGKQFDAIFETELVGIQGVPKPEKIETKVVEGAETAAEAISEAVESAASATKNVAGKVAQAVVDAADAAKTIIADTDDAPEHEEL
ncbi:hypothetical protein LB505_001810 [Fusarium chuoi]|nr:hypothetical protein LB505_001810 [Fusarium chuoi]